MCASPVLYEDWLASTFDIFSLTFSLPLNHTMHYLALHGFDAYYVFLLLIGESTHLSYHLLNNSILRIDIYLSIFAQSYIEFIFTTFLLYLYHYLY